VETERGYSEGKDTAEVNKKGKYKQEKKEASYKMQKEASNKGNTHINNNIAPNSQCLLGCIRPRRLHSVQVYKTGKKIINEWSWDYGSSPFHSQVYPITNLAGLLLRPTGEPVTGDEHGQWLLKGFIQLRFAITLGST